VGAAADYWEKMGLGTRSSFPSSQVPDAGWKWGSCSGGLSLIALFFQVADHAAFPPSPVQIDVATSETCSLVLILYKL